ncbi:MAG TPA: T9SS type A sorting domain-containing protein [Ignavibacteria bacterium]|nr:T9SS type A sorting domain-containing protein [Ignavibacteria bacterium]HMR39862.1 T9SS type A sorting domain-containing protein [Ignavibacteria bacterium]
MKSAITILVFLLSTQLSYSQFNLQINQTFNGTGNFNDAGNSIVLDNDNNIYSSGYTYGNASGYDFVTIKYNQSGDREWFRIFNGDGNGNDYAIASISRGNELIVTGLCFGGNISYDYATIKYNSSGSVLWTSIYNGTGGGNDAVSGLAIDNAGNIYVTGESYGGSTNSYDYATVKYNADGVQQWVARYNGTGSSVDAAVDICVDDQQNVYVTGQSTGKGSSVDYVTIKYNSTGAEQWVARYNGPANDIDKGTSVRVNNSGEVYVSGFSRGVGTIFDYTTIKYDNQGNEQWVRRFNGTANSSDIPSDMDIDNQGNLIITGVTNSDVNGNQSDYATLKYDPSGNLLWTSIYNGTANNNDSATALIIDNEGNIFVTGKSSGTGTSFDCVTIEYNQSGSQKYLTRYNRDGISNDFANSICLDSFKDSYITGGSALSGSYQDLIAIKYSKVSGITVLSNSIPSGFELKQNYPNPFNPVTNINYSVASGSYLSIKISDVLGNEIGTLVNEYQNPGEYSVSWNAEKYPSGVYYYSLKTDKFSETKRMLLIK